MYNDPNGEFFVFLGLGVLFWKAVIIGAAVGLASYSIGVAISGQKWTIGGALKSMFFGAVSGAVTFGIGDLFQVGSVVKAVGNAKFLVQGMAHGIAQGVLSVVQGGDFWSGAAAGFLGHMGGELWGATMKGVGLDKFAQSTMGMVTFGAISGGIGAELSGGNFWQGAVTGGIVAGLNSAMHKIDEPLSGSQDKNSKDGGEPPYKYNGKTYNSKGELYGAILLDQAAEQFGIKDILSLAAALDNQGLLSKPFQMEGASAGTSFASKYGSKLMPWEMPKRLPTHFRSGSLRYTKVFGRFVGRMAGPIGWGILAYDVGMTLYNTQKIYNNIINGK